VVIETALEKEAAARFQTTAELARALMASSGLAVGASDLLSAASDDAPPSVELEPEPEKAISLVRKKAPRGDADRPSTPGAPPSHRRHHQRAPYVTPVLLVSNTGSEIQGRSEEISQEGMLVVSPVGYPLGAPLELRFATPVTGEMIAMHATVRWTREGRGRCAMGLEFANVPPLLRGIVTQYIQMFPAAHSS
jgi:hypothetical protein